MSDSQASKNLPPPATLVGGVRHSAPLKRTGTEEAENNSTEVPKTSAETALNPSSSNATAIAQQLGAVVQAGGRAITEADLADPSSKSHPSTYTSPEPKHEKFHDRNPNTGHSSHNQFQPGGAYGQAKH